jgi:DNA-binding transcriptional MerR regulator
MDKSPEAFRTISEVADALDVPPHVLRFWETRFTQVKPVKRGGGRRYYRPEDVRLLRGIRGLLYDDGMTIKGVQKILRERGIRHVIGLGTLPETEAETEILPEPETLPETLPTPASPEPTAPAPAAAAESPAAGNGARRPQRDLFDAQTAVLTVAAPAQAAAKPADRAALRDLVGKLQSLRRTMGGDPER